MIARRVVAGLVLVAAASILAAAPASADDCSTLVKDFRDLADPGILQDCLRTGGKWSAVLGGVVGTAGVLIGASGLPGRNGAETSSNPCVQAANLHRRVGERSRALDALNQRTLQEWQARARMAEGLVHTFRTIKENEIYVTQIYNWTKTKQFAKLSIALYALYGAAGKLAQAAGAVSTATTGTQAAAAAVEAQKAAGALEAARAGMYYSVIKDFLDPDKLKDYWQLFTGTPEVDAMWKALVQMASAYQNQARAFNGEFRRWAERRQSELDALRADVRATFDRMKKAAAECPGAFNPDITSDDLLDSLDADIRLRVLEVPTQLGSRWLYPNFAGFRPWFM